MKADISATTRMGLIRKLLFLAFAAGLVAACIGLLEFTVEDFGFSVIAAAIVFAIFYWRYRHKPIATGPPAARLSMRSLLQRDLHLLLAVAIVPFIALIWPGLFNILIDAAWPILGAAMSIFALAVYTLFRRT